MVLLWIAILACVLAGIWLYAGRANSRKNAPRSADGKRPDDEARVAKDSPALKVGAAQHIGERDEQQDAYGYRKFGPLNSGHSVHDGAAGAAAEPAHSVLAVLADGMGGFAMGQEAGLLAVETMLSVYEPPAAFASHPLALEDAVLLAAEAVWELARSHELEWHVGTTLVAVVIEGQELYYLSVGDSRIYLFRDGELHRLTHDHIYANRLFERVQAGEMTLGEAISHPERDLLTSYLGLPELVELDANQEPLRLQPGDLVLLCSDGIYGELSEPLLEQTAGLEAQQTADFLVRHVIRQGRKYQDNASIVVISYG
jgi:serine/threonine protein phosphatase PrpC